jgi:hypothetical protein
MRILAALLFVSAFAFGQKPDGKNCSLDGSVVNSVNGAPILRAHVRVASASGSWYAESDAAGKWSLENIPCGPVTIHADRVGFLPPALTPARAALTADHSLHELKLELTPQAVLAGRVLDEQGDPIAGVQVSLLTSRIVNGVRGMQATYSTLTNDLGEFRFWELASGRYALCAGATGTIGAASRSYGQKCYPGPVDGVMTSAMDVAAGDEERIDLALLPVAGVRVSGIVSAPVAEGLRLKGVVSLDREIPGGRTPMGLSAAVHPDGKFLIQNVPPGTYAASTSLGNSYASARFEVADNDVEGLQLRIQPSIDVTGTVRIVSATPKKAETLRYNSVFLKSEDGLVARSIGWNGTGNSFTVNDLIPGNYRLEFLPPEHFYLKSATLDRRDMIASEVPIGPGSGTIEIVISDDGGTLEGEVSADDTPAPAWILLECDGAPFQNTRTDPTGHFKFETVPPGDYKIYAWDDNTNVEYASPEWMRQNGKGVTVTVDPGQTAQVKVTRQIAPPE